MFSVEPTVYRRALAIGGSSVIWRTGQAASITPAWVTACRTMLLRCLSPEKTG